ncbi:MAG: hypothetical protein ACREJC_15195 [Tepidisphaeraceae bacterium]
MGDSYIPTPDGLALTWMQTFAAGITAAPALYQMSVPDAQNIQNVVNAYGAAYAVAVDPATRTPVSVAFKDEARNLAEQICRQFAMLIKVNSGISDSDKIAIGVRPVNPDRNPINVPASSPLLNVLGATPGSHTVRYSDTSAPGDPAKPFGAAQIQIFVAIGTDATTDEDKAEFYGAFTKNPVGVGFKPEDDGKMATYFARWASRKGDVGPWSLPVSMRIAA